MIYVVEMDFLDTAREHDWHTWYITHITQLVRNVPGFTATQRFRCLTPTPSPWLAMYEVEGPQVFESAEYKANGGPASTGEWKDKHANWYRNLFDGMATTPDVGFDEHLLMAEGDAQVPEPFEAMLVTLLSAGLDKSSAGRRIAVIRKGQLAARLFGVDGVRVFKPITPRIRA